MVALDYCLVQRWTYLGAFKGKRTFSSLPGREGGREGRSWGPRGKGELEVYMEGRKEPNTKREEAEDEEKIICTPVPVRSLLYG